MDARQALDRTLLLSRDLIEGEAKSDAAVLRELTSMRVAIVADERNVTTNWAQTLITTLTSLLVECGAQLCFTFADVDVVGEQPPLRGRSLRTALSELASDSVPSRVADDGAFDSDVDVMFAIGDSPALRCRGLSWRLHGEDWRGSMSAVNEAVPLVTGSLPFGAGAAAALASVEPFKIAIRRAAAALGVKAPIPELLAPTAQASITFTAPAAAWQGRDIGSVDFISAGAINTAALHVLHRVPNLRLSGRIVDDDILEASNLNRYLLARRADVEARRSKVAAVAQWNTGGVALTPLLERYTAESLPRINPLAQRVVVGADDVPTRWLVQEQWPSWLGVGATGNVLVQVSEHSPGQPCAGCMHPTDDAVRMAIPTMSTVSYWAGLLLAARLIRSAMGTRVERDEQAVDLWPLRLDLKTSLVFRGVPRNPRCPVKCEPAGQGRGAPPDR